MQLRLAPLSEIAATPWRAVLGDELSGGLPDLHHGLDIAPLGDAAVVLVHDEQGPHAFVVDAEGKLSPLSGVD